MSVCIESVGDEEFIILPLLVVPVTPILFVDGVLRTQARGGQLEG
jgi:hypothetical protein